MNSEKKCSLIALIKMAQEDLLQKAQNVSYTQTSRHCWVKDIQILQTALMTIEESI